MRMPCGTWAQLYRRCGGTSESPRSGFDALRADSESQFPVERCFRGPSGREVEAIVLSSESLGLRLYLNVLQQLFVLAYRQGSMHVHSRCHSDPDPGHHNHNLAAACQFDTIYLADSVRRNSPVNRPTLIDQSTSEPYGTNTL